MKLRGLTVDEFAAALLLDEFWSKKIFEKFDYGLGRMQLFQFIYVCTTLRPCKTDESLLQKAEVMACAIADIGPNESIHSVVERSRVEAFINESGKKGISIYRDRFEVILASNY